MAANLAAMAADLEDPSAARGLFRQVMGRFATGVTVITTSLSGEVFGMTANAFMAGSLEPMLCVVSINRTAKMHERLCESGHYGVSFLSQEQRHLSAHFAGQRVGHVDPEFCFRGRTPVVRHAVAAVTAEVLDAVACGDHTLFVGRIASLEAAAARRPLLFYGGRYARMDLLSPIEEVEPPAFW